MNRNLLWLLTALLLACMHLAEAQQPKRIHQIGFLGATPSSVISDRLEAFRQGLRELGYVEGKNILIEYRYAEGKLDRLPALASELVHLKLNVIVAAGPQATRRVKEATGTIPIVMAYVFDPVGDGFVASLARPGGNITGLSTLAPEISGKQLEFLREIVPRGHHRQFDRPGPRTSGGTHGTRRSRVGGATPISRRASSRGY
jgi:putative ABC transport system substrate-binding protein